MFLRNPWVRGLFSVISLYLLCGSLAGDTPKSFGAKEIIKSAVVDEEVAEWMRTTTNALNAASTVVQTTRGPIEYIKIGSGPVVLCMHGGPGGYDQSALIGRHLISHGFSVLGVSRPGYLRTPLIPGTNDTPALQADTMIALMDAIGIPKAAVLGFSAGSIVGFEMALNYPNRVSALLMEGIGVQPDDGDFYNFVLGLLQDEEVLDPTSFALYWDLYNDEQDTMALFLSMDTDMDLFAQASRQQYVTRHQKQFYFDFFKTLLPLRLRREGLINDINVVDLWSDYKSRGLLQQIAVKTMIVQSRNDTSGNYTQAVEIASLIPHCQLVSLDKTGHFCWLGENTTAWENTAAAFLHTLSGTLQHLRISRTGTNATLSWNPLVGCYKPNPP